MDSGRAAGGPARDYAAHVPGAVESGASELALGRWAIIAEHDGELLYEPRTNGGSRFVLHIPLGG